MFDISVDMEKNGEKKENDIESSHKLRFVNYYIFAARRHRPYFNI